MYIYMIIFYLSNLDFIYPYVDSEKVGQISANNQSSHSVIDVEEAVMDQQSTESKEKKDNNEIEDEKDSLVLINKKVDDHGFKPNDNTVNYKSYDYAKDRQADAYMDSYAPWMDDGMCILHFVQYAQYDICKYWYIVFLHFTLGEVYHKTRC